MPTPTNPNGPNAPPPQDGEDEEQYVLAGQEDDDNLLTLEDLVEDDEDESSEFEDDEAPMEVRVGSSGTALAPSGTVLGDETPEAEATVARYQQLIARQLASGVAPGTDVRDWAKQVLERDGSMTEDNYLRLLDEHGHAAAKQTRKLLVYDIAPVLYEMREKRGWERLIDTEFDGKPYTSWDAWCQRRFQLSHTRATNIIALWQHVLPALERQGADLADALSLDEAKLLLLVPVYNQWRAERERLAAEAQRTGTQVEMPTEPDLVQHLADAQQQNLRDFKTTLTGAPTEKTKVNFEVVFQRLPSGNYNFVLRNLNKAQARHFNQRLTPRYTDARTGEVTPLWQEFEED